MGFFAVDYGTRDAPQRMLTTQFEVADARRFAPMWDEPTAKATFTLEVVIPRDRTAYSNMPVEAITSAGDLHVVRFARSPKMSSYLLHLTVGDLERISRKVAGVDIGVVTRRGASGMGRMSLDAAAQILPWYDDYFGTPYPLPKLDMIAVPGSSEFFGAMENWGAIMYFEPALLVDPKLSSDSERMGIFNVVAHEMAHQWFGNLVTMNWWDELWLNEGYATWMASKVAAKLRPDWDSDLAAVRWSREHAMRVDAGDATHPIVQPVATVEAANQAFDSIAYNKGGAVIRMIEATGGEVGFREGIRRYMHRYAYGNAITEKLWAELAAATNQPLIDLARDFTLQPGVPLVKVEPGACVEGHTRVTLSQARFESGRPSPIPQTWLIPVRLQALDTGSAGAAMLQKDGRPVTVEMAGCGPFVANPGQAMYFRTQYADPEFARLRGNFDRLADVDRLGLLNDAAALSQNGTIAATRYLELASAVPPGSHPYILAQLADEFAEIDRLLQGSPQQEAWRAYARQRLQPVFDRVGWLPVHGESQPTALLRESLIAALGRLADPAVLAGARDRLLRSATDPAVLPATIYGPVLEVSASHADASTWEEIRRRARSIEDPRQKQVYYGALGQARDPALVRRNLELALSGEPPRSAVSGLIRAVAEDHPAEAFRFAVLHEQAVSEYLDASSRWGFIPRLGVTSYDPSLADEIQAYVERSTPTDARAVAARTIAEIRARGAVRSRQVPALEAWLRSLH
jgi:aminopeptidase N